MGTKRFLIVLSVAMSFISWFSHGAVGDIIKFTRGARKQCVVIEQTEKSVRFLTSMGEIEMPLAKIESIERESDEVNAALKKEWAGRKTKAPKEPEVKPEPVDEKPKILRTYNIDITKRRISLGGKGGVGEAQPMVSFVVQDYGMVEGSRLFNISVTSYKSTSADLSPANFHALLTNGARVDPKPLEGYDALDKRVGLNQTVTGYLAFSTDADIKTIVLRSDLTDFDLNLETGEFITPRTGLF
ncbi:hypothetical protein HZA56_00500 [Candidatus Poribacteria bacterium]|nr:hypothetical protein [Candidatus Poribacteria bacterium]